MTSLIPWRIAADTGGTFTDCHAISPEGRELRVKVLSSGCLRTMAVISHDDPHELILSNDWDQPAGFFKGYRLRFLGAVVQEYRIAQSIPVESGGVKLILDKALSAPLTESTLVELTIGEAAPVLAARLITHTPLNGEFPYLIFRLATTRATNALLEHKGTDVAFFITQGFADLLRIGDQRRKDLFALKHEDRQVYYSQVHEVAERLDAQGQTLTPIDEERLRVSARQALQQGITTAAVSLLHSDINSAHENQVRDILIQEGFHHVSLSSELAPFIKILPRAQSVVANAYLTGPVNRFLTDVRSPLGGNTPLFMMTSAASLEPASSIHPKDLLLSGPAAGVLGALNAAQDLGYEKIITFDMGGTSTDVARLDGVVGYRFHQQISGLTLLSPSVAIETVAAGGGSICAWTPSGLAVGPHSAGSDPGPACYGKGGPLTVTDINLLLGRFDPNKAPIPLRKDASLQKLNELRHEVKEQSGRCMSEDELLQILLAIANQHMADAIRKISVLEGYAPEGYALLAFGGAGPQHACDIAELLGIKTILVPHHAGILSAVGLQQAKPERFAQRQILKKLSEVQNDLSLYISDLGYEAAKQLLITTVHDETPQLRNLAELRLTGQDSTLQFEFTNPDTLQSDFEKRYFRLFGYPPPPTKTLEIVSLRVIATATSVSWKRNLADQVVEKLDGPKLVQDGFSTLMISSGWQAANHEGQGWVLNHAQNRATNIAENPAANVQQSQDVLRHRLHGIVEDMGALLRRTALSTNIRERLDFSCALLTRDGILLTSAPHIPVHLGALGVCVREVMKQHTFKPGDTYITNHPAFGGSHLPDITLITPVFDAQQELLGIVANRAHHAEIGGIAPGSMPANAILLHQEGVVIPPGILIRDDVSHFDEIRHLLTHAPHPTRAVDDNIADLHAQLAANRMGVGRLLSLANEVLDIRQIMDSILDESREVMQHFLPDFNTAEASDTLDDDTPLCVKLSLHKDVPSRHQLTIDFSGSGKQHSGNLNATPAIIHSAVLYVLRLALQKDLPLNEGLLSDVNIILPEGSFLNPDFSDESTLPAVVGGNVEISQRVVAVLIEALNLQAGSQGTMNNFLFGNERFGYYETICGGMGAGDGYHGASAQHSHMTNTAITDPEVLERRFPIRLHSFGIRKDSGGYGEWRGGNGIIREVEFLQPLTVSLLTQHRRKGAKGMQGGKNGQPGIQQLTRNGSHPETLPSSVTFDATPGDLIRIETPGGGGWGNAVDTN